MSGDRPSKRAGRRPGRRGSKMDVRSKLERSRQSARECRARKKLRYQYLEDLVANREKAVFALRDELELCKQWCIQVDDGLLPFALQQLCQKFEKVGLHDPSQHNNSQHDVVVISTDSEESDEIDEEISERSDVQKVPYQFVFSGNVHNATGDSDIFKVPVLKKYKLDEGQVVHSDRATNQSFASKYTRADIGDINDVFKIANLPLETKVSLSVPSEIFHNGATGSAADTDIFTTIRMDNILQDANLNQMSADDTTEVMHAVKDVPSLFANIGRTSETSEPSDGDSGIMINEEKCTEITDVARGGDAQVGKIQLPTIIEEPDC